MEKLINVAELLQSSSLRLRTSVGPLLEADEMSRSGGPVFDFSGIEFASRSFMDEFYNQLIVDRHASVTNMSCSVQEVLDSVRGTQVPSSKRIGLSDIRIDTVRSLDDLTSELKGLSYL